MHLIQRHLPRRSEARSPRMCPCLRDWADDDSRIQVKSRQRKQDEAASNSPCCALHSFDSIPKTSALDEELEAFPALNGLGIWGLSLGCTVKQACFRLFTRAAVKRMTMNDWPCLRKRDRSSTRTAQRANPKSGRTRKWCCLLPGHLDCTRSRSSAWIRSRRLGLGLPYKAHRNFDAIGYSCGRGSNTHVSIHCIHLCSRRGEPAFAHAAHALADNEAAVGN